MLRLKLFIAHDRGKPLYQFPRLFGLFVQMAVIEVCSESQFMTFLKFEVLKILRLAIIKRENLSSQISLS